MQFTVCAKGIPRTINLLSEHALITAYVEELRPIPSRIVEGIVPRIRS